MENRGTLGAQLEEVGLMEIHDSDRLDAQRSPGLHRVAMAIVLTAGVLAAMTAFSGVGLAGTSHGTPAHDQYKPHHH
jgi:hypothetical protein